MTFMIYPCFSWRHGVRHPSFSCVISRSSSWTNRTGERSEPVKDERRCLKSRDAQRSEHRRGLKAPPRRHHLSTERKRLTIRASGASANTPFLHVHHRCRPHDDDGRGWARMGRGHSYIFPLNPMQVSILGQSPRSTIQGSPVCRVHRQDRCIDCDSR